VPLQLSTERPSPWNNAVVKFHKYQEFAGIRNGALWTRREDTTKILQLILCSFTA
jgi:hypothetical protein